MKEKVIWILLIVLIAAGRVGAQSADKPEVCVDEEEFFLSMQAVYGNNVQALMVLKGEQAEQFIGELNKIPGKAVAGDSALVLVMYKAPNVHISLYKKYDEDCLMYGLFLHVGDLYKILQSMGALEDKKQSSGRDSSGVES